MMQPPRNHGLGLRTDMPPKPEAVLSTAPASPTDEMPELKPAHSRGDDEPANTTPPTAHVMPPQHSTVAQLSFGPATQQTITTVTTTTTVSLPPLVFKPPRDLFERDPKQYPLAF